MINIDRFVIRTEKCSFDGPPGGVAKEKCIPNRSNRSSCRSLDNNSLCACEHGRGSEYGKCFLQKEKCYCCYCNSDYDDDKDDDDDGVGGGGDDGDDGGGGGDGGGGDVGDGEGEGDVDGDGDGDRDGDDDDGDGGGDGGDGDGERVGSNHVRTICNVAAQRGKSRNAFRLSCIAGSRKEGIYCDGQTLN